MTLKCLFYGHKYRVVGYRHNGIHLVCGQCGKYLWRPFNIEEGEIFPSSLGKD